MSSLPEQSEQLLVGQAPTIEQRYYLVSLEGEGNSLPMAFAPNRTSKTKFIRF